MCRHVASRPVWPKNSIPATTPVSGVPQPVAQFHFVLANRIDAALLNEVQPRDEADDAEHVRRAALEVVRVVRTAASV